MKKNIQGKKVLKTFNLDADIYEEFSNYCKREGISMSKRVEHFIKSELEKIRLFSGFGKVVGKTKRSDTVDVKEEHSFKKYC